MENEKQMLLEEIKQKRGYVLSFHKILAEEAPDFLRCYEDLISVAYTKEGVLDRKVKEFVFIAALTALSADKKHIGAHIRVAVENGATKKEILDVLRCIYPPCGTLKLMNGLEAFEDVFGAEEKLKTEVYHED